MKKWIVYSTEKVEYEWPVIEAETEDEACQIANETWTNARVVDTGVTEMRTISWEVKENK